MKKMRWILFLCLIVAGIILYSLSHYNRKHAIYDFIVEKCGEDAVDCKPLRELGKINSDNASFIERKVSLQSGPTTYGSEVLIPLLRRDINLLIPETSEEKTAEGMYLFTSSNILFALRIQNGMRFEIKAIPVLLNNWLEEKKIKCNLKLMNSVRDELLAEKDEVSFIKSLSIHLKDIKNGPFQDVFSRAVLFYSLRCAYSVTPEPSVVHEGSSSLYLFSEYRGADELFIEWILYKNEDFNYSGVILLRNLNKNENAFDNLVAYLKTILSREMVD